MTHGSASDVSPRTLAKKFNQDIADERGNDCNAEIGRRKEIAQARPLFSPMPERSIHPPKGLNRTERK
jgi:hypothetical protein